MLHKILQIMNENGIQSQVELARRLGVHPDMVAQILRTLVQTGYLEATSTDCLSTEMDSSCTGCGAASGCNPLHGQMLWSLTVKGRKAVMSEAHA
jgi:DNA-binding IclR family transcriptional regulator